MKKVLFLTVSLICILSFDIKAQHISIDEPDAQEQKRDKNYIYNVAETQPEFKGGNTEFLKYINKSINLPKTDEPFKKIILTFVVERDGKLSDVKIVRGSNNADLDKEVLRIAKGSPKWIPGTMSGKPVRVQFSVPLIIDIEKR